MLPLLLALLPARALADEPLPDGWWVGMRVSSVRIESPSGGAPEESLDPLLRTRQGEALDANAVRLDIATLFRAGEFASVEAVAEPWADYDDQGNLIETVQLTYRVAPAPRVAHVRVQGAREVRQRDVLDAADVSVGEAFYAEVDAPRVADRVVELYRQKGFPGARVDVRLEPGRRGLDVVLAIAEGEPRTVDRLAFTGDLPVPERRLRRILRREGLEEGRPFALEAIQRGQEAIRRDLAEPGSFWDPHGGTPFAPKGGWIEARVVPAVTGDVGRGLQVTYGVEAGPRLVLDVDGLAFRARAKTRDALGIDERLRLTRGFVEDAPERMTEWLQRRGWFDAAVGVELVDRDDTRVLRVRIDRGARHYLVVENPLFGRLLGVDPGVSFEGNGALDDDDLRAVMEQASDDVLRLHYVTRSAIDEGIVAAQDLYRSKGYEDAAITLRAIEERRPPVLSFGMLRSVWAAFTPALAPVAVRLRFDVDEGPLTRLRELAIHGAADGVELGFAVQRKDALVGAPFSPQALEELSRAIVDAHRDAGWLEADARVLHRRDGDEVASTITVDPGPRILLRSLVISGARRTRSEFVRRRIDLPLGQPLGAADLEQLRRDLYGLGVFRSVDTDVVGDGAVRDLVVTVRERPRWSFELGGGVSTDQGVRGFGRATRHNLFGTAQRVELFGLAGLQYESDAITNWLPDLRQPEWRAAASWTAPSFPGRDQEVTVDWLLREEIQERTWRMARTGVGAAIDSRLSRHTRVRTGVRGETRRLQEVDVGALLDGEPWAELVEDGEIDLPSPWREQHAANVLLLQDFRDDPLQPTRGVLLSALAELSPALSVGIGNELPTVGYLKGEARASGYVPLGPFTLHLAGEGGRSLVLGDGVLALEDRYRLGGTGSMRGFKRDEVGPKNRVAQPDVDWPDQLDPVVSETVRDDPTRWAATGGDVRAVGTVELLVPLPVLGLHAFEGYALSLFTDVGNVWLLDAATTPTSEQAETRAIYDPVVRYGVGVGLNVATPVGPLQIDLAMNPDAAFATGPERVLLRREWEEPAFRFHLSLGTLF